jgi:hypothetical protein
MQKPIIGKNAKGGGKFKLCLSAAAICWAFCGMNADDKSAVGWAETTITLDSAEPVRMAGGAGEIVYNAGWCTGADAAGATVVLKAVTAPDTDNAVTSAVPLAAGADASEGVVEYEGSGYMRFILSAELDGVPVGEKLVGDVAFGESSAFSAKMPFDGRTNMLQEAVNAKVSVPVRYDLQWANVASNAEISLVCVRRKKSGEILDVTTNFLFSADSPATGEVDLVTANLRWGEYKLMLREYAGDGALILEKASPEFSIAHVYGTCVVIR